MKRRYPPRVNATPEEMARAMFDLPADHKWEYENEDGKAYQCASASVRWLTLRHCTATDGARTATTPQSARPGRYF